MFGKKKNKKAFNGQVIKSQFSLWSINARILLLLLCIADIFLLFINKPSAVVLLAVLIVYYIVYIVMYYYFQPKCIRQMMDFAAGYSQIQRKLINNLSIPYCMMDMNGKILWINKAMARCTEKRKDYGKSISSIFPEISADKFPLEGESKEVHINYNDRDYCVEMNSIKCDIDNWSDENEELIQQSDDKFHFIAMYMFDETKINRYIQTLKDEKFVAGLIYIDNYEEALESIDDVRRSLFIGLIDKRVNKYFSSGAAIVRKLEKDKYIVSFRYKYLEKLMNDKFSILEDIKNVKIGNEMTITLSIGIGTGLSDYSSDYDLAKSAMDLALGRGGDQAVIKDGEKIFYYGGKSQQMEKNTRVKVRVKAHALRQILDTTDSVMVMGHSIGDIDSFGSAIGIYAICRKLKKDIHIVINDVTTSVNPFKERFMGKEEYPKNLFMTSQEAMEYVTPETAVIVVDVNRPERTECPELLERRKTIVVFDHHRQSSDQIQGAVLSYVDPYASSASEMITEMIQYVDDNVKLKAFEADALYAGINIDTDGFHNKSGPRTFEAAAFLRRNGADVTRVRKMLRNDMAEYRAVAHAVSRAEVYKDAFAITVFDGDGLKSPTIGGAKASNQLLDISGIKASFVLTQYNDRIFISARSIDEINVQLIMEQLGGGGHMSIAGAQMSGCSISDAIVKIKEVLDRMLADGDI